MKIKIEACNCFKAMIKLGKTIRRNKKDKLYNRKLNLGLFWPVVWYSGGTEVRNSCILGNFWKNKVLTCTYALGTNKIDCKNEKNLLKLRICNEILVD